MKHRFLARAREEYLKAVTYYSKIGCGLDVRFTTEIDSVVALISDKPFRFAKRMGKLRRANCKIFPFYVAYYIDEDCIVIVAVGHASRRPNYWKKRISKSQ